MACGIATIFLLHVCALCQGSPFPHICSASVKLLRRLRRCASATPVFRCCCAFALLALHGRLPTHALLGPCLYPLHVLELPITSASRAAGTARSSCCEAAHGWTIPASSQGMVIFLSFECGRATFPRRSGLRAHAFLRPPSSFNFLLLEICVGS